MSLIPVRTGEERRVRLTLLHKTDRLEWREATREEASIRASGQSQSGVGEGLGVSVCVWGVTE